MTESFIILAEYGPMGHQLPFGVVVTQYPQRALQYEVAILIHGRKTVYHNHQQRTEADECAQREFKFWHTILSGVFQKGYDAAVAQD